jgi:hypothetical protein
MAGRALSQAPARWCRGERVALDPGIGFGKTPRHNFELLARLEELAALGRRWWWGIAQELPREARRRGSRGCGVSAVRREWRRRRALP